MQFRMELVKDAKKEMKKSKFRGMAEVAASFENREFSLDFKLLFDYWYILVGIV